MSVNAEYNYNKVLEQIRDEYRNIKNSDEYKHASRRTKEKIDNIFKELHADYLNKERALSETYRAIEEQDLAQERVEEGRKARKDTNLVSRYLGDFAKSAGEHTVNDILKLTALGQQTLGYKDAAQKTAQLSQDISENMEDAFGRKAEWTTKENEWRPDSLESAIDAGLSTAIDVGTLIYSPLNAGANMIAGKAAALGGQKVASALGNGIVGKLAGGAVNAIPTSVAMSLPELYGDQFDFDEYGNVILPKSVLPTYLLSIPHGMVEHLGIDPRKPFTQTIRKSIWKALKDYANPINIAKRAGGEGLEEGLQDAMSMFNKRASDATGTDKSIMQVMGEWMADVEEKYPQLLQSVFLGGIGGALMFEDAGNIKSNKELRAQRQNVQRQINDILTITNNLEITNSDADRNQLINDIDRALQGYDVRIADNSVSMAARQQAAKDKQNDQEQQQLVMLKQEQDKAAEMLNNYVYNMDAQNRADNSTKSSLLNLPFADNNDYDYNTIYDNLVGEALAQQLRDNTERNKGNQEKYLQEWNTLPEEQQGQYKDANEYIAERMATDEETNDIESRRTEFAQEYANLSPEDRAKYKDSADYVERRVNQETQKQRQKGNIGRSSRMLSAITSQRNKQERINRQKNRIKGYKADVANIREWKRKSLAEQEERKQQIVEQLKKQRQALREWQIDQRLKSEQDDFENEKRLAALRGQREKTIKAQEEALNEFIENDKTEAQINEIQAKLRQFEQRQDVKSLDDAINLLSKFQFGIADRKTDYKMDKRNTSTLLTYDNNVKNSRENMSFAERTEEAKHKIKELKTALNNIEDKDSDYFKEVAAADYMINTLQNELNKDLSDSEIHEIIEAIDDLYNRFFYLGEEEEKKEQPQQQQQNNEYEEYADEIAQHEAEREQPQQKNETTTIQMKNDLKGKKLGIKSDINTSKAERNSSIDSRLNERMTFRDREETIKGRDIDIGGIITEQQKKNETPVAEEETKPVEQKQENTDKYENYSFKRKTSEITKEQSDAIIRGKTVNIIKSLEVTKGKDGYRMNFGLTSLSRSFYPISGEQIIYTQDRDIVDRYAKSIEEADKNGIILDFGDLRKSIEENKQQQPAQQTEAKPNISELTKSRDAVLPKRTENRIFKEDEFKKRMARLRSAANRIGVNPFADPQIVEDALYCSCYLIESGARKFADYCKQMVENLGEQAKVFKDYLAGFYMMAKKDPRLKALNIDKKEFSTEDEVDSFDIDSLFAKPVEQKKEDVAEKATTETAEAQQEEVKKEQSNNTVVEKAKDKSKEAYDGILNRYQMYKDFNKNRKTQAFEEWLNGYIQLLENSNPNANGVKEVLESARLAKEYYEKNIKQKEQQEEQTKESNDNYSMKNARILFETTAKNVNKATNNVQKLECSLVDILKGRLDNNWLKNKCVELGIINKEDWATNKNKCQQYFEAAIAYWARRLVNKELNDKKFNASEVLKVIYENQPLIGTSAKTDITKSMQQYSTPIYLSNLLVKALNLKNTDSVYEPTAGNGLLISSAIPIVADVYLNELDKTRVKNLSYALGAHVTAITNEDALKKVVPGLANVFIANPPFGPLSQHGGQDYHYNYRGNDFVIKKIDHAIILRGLETVVKKNNGKAVVIYGGFMRESDYNSMDNKIFQRLLENDYNIVGQFVVGGDLYTRQGTKFPVVVTFIDGKNTENGEEHLKDLRSIPVYDKWNDVETALQDIGEVFRNGQRTERKENAGTMEQQKQRNSERIEQSVDRQTDRNNAEELGNETNRNTEQQRHSETTRNNDGRNKDLAERPELRGQTEPDTRGTTDNERSYNRNGEQRRNEGNNRQRSNGQVSRTVHNESDKNDEESRLPGRSNSDSRLEQSRRGDISERNDVKEKSEEKKVELDENLQSRYNSPSHNKNSNGAVVPKNLQKSIEQSLNELEEEKGDLVKYVSDFCGIDAYNVLFREQNDAVALACAQMEKNNGSGIVIADDTGTGKGRCCAAIMAASIKHGRIPVFMTNKSGLFGEMRNDMLGVGLSEVVPFIVNNDSDILEQDGKTVAFKKLGDTAYKNVLKNLREGNLQDFQGKTKKFDCIFVTYSQFKDVNTSVDNRLNALVRNSKNIDIILDESHAAAGEAKVGRSGRENDINFTNTLTHVIRLIQDVNSCTYLSATWLKNIKNLPLYNKIFPEGYNRQQLVEAIGRAGLIGQEVFVDMLTKNGMYIRREHSYKGVNFGTTKVTTDVNAEIERSDNFGKIITSSQTIVNRIKTELKDIARNNAERLIGLTGHYTDTGEAVEITRGLILGARAEAGERSLGQANITSPFSIAHNHLNAFLVAMKIENTANAVVKAIQNGEKPVIGLQNTQEALLKDLTIGTTTHMTFSDSLRRVVDSAGTSTITITEPSSRRKIKIDIPPELVGSDVINQAKNEIVKLVDSEFFKSLPISPIDMLIKRIEEIGTQKLGYPVKVGEITGRETRLQYDETGRSAKVLKRIKTVTEHQKIRTLFNNQTVKNGKNDGYDAIIINTSACNGISLHAGKDFKNQNKRIMFILQPIAEINSMVQLLGRIMRAGQVVLPSYEYVVTSLQSETRIVNNLQRKLKNLSANTTSSKESNKNFVETDVYNHYGDDAAVEWVNSHLDLANSLELLNQDGDIKEPQGDDLLINKIAGKVAFLPQNQQIEFWNFIKETYTNIVEEAKKDGSYDLEPKTYKDSAAKTLSKDRLDNNSSKKKAVYRENVEMKIHGEPLEFSQALYRAENRKGFVNVFDGSFVTGLKRDIRESVENLRNTPKEDGTEYTDEEIERIIEYHEDELDNILEKIKSKYHLGNVYHFNASRRVKNSRTNKFEVIEKKYYGMLRAILYIKNSNNIANENNVVLKLYAPGEKNEATLRLGDVDGMYDYGNIIENSEKIKEIWDKEYNNNKEKIKKMTVLTGDLIEGSSYVEGNPEAANFQREDGSFSYGWILDNGDSVVIPEKPIKEYTGNEGIKHIEAPELGIDIYTSNYSGNERFKGLTITKRGLSDDKLNTLKQALGIESINLGSGKYRGKYVLDTRISDEQVNNVIHAFSDYEFIEKKTAEERERALRDKINANNENNNDDVHFSISQSKVSKAIGIDKLNAIAKKIGNALNQKLGLGLVVCKDSAELGNKLREAGAKIETIPQGAEGCVFNGNVYLVADNIQDGNRVYSVLAHEIAGHVGAEKIYPHFNALMKQLLKLENSDEKIKAIFDDVRKNYNEKDDIRVAAEVFAKVMEQVYENENSFTGKIKNLVNFFIKKVKDFFRSLFGMNIPMSESEVYAIANNIMKATTVKSIMKGEVAGTNIYDESKAFEKEPVFSIPSDIFEFNAYLEREEKKQNNGSNVVQLSSMETFDKGVAEGKRLAEVERKEQQEKVKTAARLAKLAKNRQKGLDYLAQQERVNKAIEESRKPKKTTLAQKVEAVENWLALKFANKRQRLVEFQDTIEKALGHKLADYMNPHRQLDTIDGRIQYRTEAFNNKYFKPLYDYLVKNGITYDDFNKFTYAMHAEERDKYIREINPTFRDNNKRGSGWDNAKMGGTEQQVLDSLYQKYGQDKLMNAGKMFWNMNKAVIDLQEQYGLIDKKTADNIRARYKYYTPLKHIADDEVTTKVVERALGRTSTAQDNLMFATAAIDTTIRWGEKNNAKLAMLNLANVYKTPMVEINRQKLEQYFNPETGEVEIRLDRSRPDNTITARANGVNYNITFKDEELYKAFTSEQRTSEAWNAIVKTSRVFTNMMGFVSTMANPDFGIANFVRDQSQSGLENIVYRGMKFASNAFHYALPAIKTYIDYRRGIDNEDTRLYKEFLENGGLTGYADMLRLDKRAVNLDKSISEDIEANKGVLGKLKKLAKNPSDVIHGIFGLFEAFNDSLESATRFGVYREARKTGTALEAAELAKNITINFNRHGSLWSSDMNALYLFSNANIQGTRKAWQLLKYAARDNKGRSIIGSLVAAGFISEILGHMFAGFDPDDEVSYYDKLEEWKKDGNLVIFTGGKKYVSMPLSPVVAFPYMIGRNTAAYMTGKKNMSTAITDIFSNFITTLNPLGEDSKSLGSIVPTPMRPLVDLWTNKKWNAAKIRPEQTNGMKKPEHQLYFDNKTSKVFVDLAKWLSDVTGGDEYIGGKIDLSPADMQYLAENYSGGLGKSLYKGYKLATSQAESLDDIPLLRRFRGEANEYSTAREYKDNKEIADRYSRVKSDRNFDYLNKNKSYIRISNIIKVADKQIDRIRERKNLSEAEKELAVTKIQKNANTAIRKLQ